MKSLKIILAILAAIGIGLAVYFGYTKTTVVDEIGLPENQFTRRVEQEILDISNKSESRFCKDAYDIVKYHIEDYASLNRLGATPTDTLGNSQNQSFLFKRLYSAYAEKFIAQADHVFKGSAWTSGDLSFIKSEAGRLRSVGKQNDCLEANGTVDKDLSRLTRTIDSYNSEIAFINECKSFSYSNVDLDRRFPVDRAASIINDSKSHLSSLGVVKNSEAVNTGLTGIPDRVLSVHVSYLTRKLNEYKEMYMYYNTLAAYRTNFYDNLKAEISQLDNSMYSGLNVSSQKTRLMNSLEADHRAASAYFQNR